MNRINHFQLMDQIRHHETSHVRHDPFSHVSLEGRNSLERTTPIHHPMSRPVQYEPEGTPSVIERPYLTDVDFGKTITPSTPTPDISAAPVYKSPTYLESLLRPIPESNSVIPEEPKYGAFARVLPKYDGLSVIPEEPKVKLYEVEGYRPIGVNIIPEETKPSYLVEDLPIIKPIKPRISEFNTIPDEPQVNNYGNNFSSVNNQESITDVLDRVRREKEEARTEMLIQSFKNNY
ncbi:MAG: hypothetical protein ACMXX9_02365 [Candidatus Woesearchaeota archaeon]